MTPDNSEPKWAVYDFQCPLCGTYYREADHGRRDPSTMGPFSHCRGRARMIFAGKKPLAEVSEEDSEGMD